MSLAGADLWDPQQREWLQAMGHSVLVLATDEPEPASAVGQEDVAEAVTAVETGYARGAEATASHDPAATIEPKPAPRVRQAPPSPPDQPSEPSAPARPRTDPAAKLAALAVARQAGVVRNVSGPLGEALLRATRQPPAAAARMLRELAVDPAALRDDPAAKRALWARLRSLRKDAQ